jgi:putative transposase
MRIIEPLEPGSTYHIFNRGNNSENIFREEKDYARFLHNYAKYCSLIFETYAYALLKNHFHLAVKVNEDIFVERTDGKGLLQLNASTQLSHLFNSYAQYFNKSYNRHGKLFEVPFRRKLVVEENYFTSLIHYVHANPQTHGFVHNFKSWPYTSWNCIAHAKTSFVATDKIIEWFGGRRNFMDYHQSSDDIPGFIIE